MHSIVGPQRALPWRALALAVVLTAAGCAAQQSAAEGPADAPPPTIGLSTEFGDAAVVPSDIVDAVADDPDAVESIVMIGDSITVGAHDALVSAFAGAGFDDVGIHAVPGKRTAVSSASNPSGVRVADEIRASDPDPTGELWIVALGTNDIAQYGDADAIAAAIGEMLSALPASAPVVWVDTYWRDRPDATQLVNDAIRQAVDARGNAVVTPWSDIAPTEGLLTNDGVHPRPAGAEAFAALTATTVAAFLDRS